VPAEARQAVRLYRASDVAIARAGVVEAQTFVPPAGVGDRHECGRVDRGPCAADPNRRHAQRVDPVPQPDREHLFEFGQCAQ